MSEYQVLARKYRPQNFDNLIGQDVLVRTLSNAIKNNRVAHAFLLTGIRGIGKTTTARIIARALNCIGEDGKGEATISPCGVCSNCTQIKGDRHVDVIEMDAASRTGVGDIRSLIETVHYAPTSARYKIYIIDEVHMLSNSAFNALLKTLEEPPPSVIFIFATTEIHKIPVTILSRCQRFDLKRVDLAMLSNHLQNICGKENITASEDALNLISMAAEGSVRDALSLLDRAISHNISSDGGVDSSEEISADSIRSMLGLADKTRIFTLLEALFSGDINAALGALQSQYKDGSDITLLFSNMLSVVHSITRMKIDPNDKLEASYSQTEREKASELASKLALPILSRAWQMLLKGFDEVKRSPDSLQAAEMVLIRFAYMADMPSPAELIKTIKNNQQAVATSAAPSAVAGTVLSSAPQPAVAANTMASAVAVQSQAQPQISSETQASHLTLAANNPIIKIDSFQDIVGYFRLEREAATLYSLEHEVALISFEVGHIQLKKVADVPNDFIKTISLQLKKITGDDWKISFANGDAQPTIAAQKKERKLAEIVEVKELPLVKTILENFEGSEIDTVKTKTD